MQTPLGKFTMIAFFLLVCAIPSRTFGQDRFPIQRVGQLKYPEMLEDCMAAHTAWSKESCESQIRAAEQDPKLLQCLRNNPALLLEKCANWEEGATWDYMARTWVAPKPKSAKRKAAVTTPEPGQPTVPYGPQPPTYAEAHPIAHAIENTVLVLVVGVIAFVMYFLPGITASRRHHRQEGAIWTLNFALGWTLIGWVVALVWANTVPEPAPTVIVQQAAIPGADFERAPQAPAKVN